MLTYAPPGGSGGLAAIGDGYAIGSSFCTTDNEPCGAQAVSLDSRAVGDLPGYPTAIDEDGGLVLLQFPPSTVETRGFSLYDIARRQARPVFAIDGSVEPTTGGRSTHP